MKISLKSFHFILPPSAFILCLPKRSGYFFFFFGAAATVGCGAGGIWLTGAG
jgi:hypothetical protein